MFLGLNDQELRRRPPACEILDNYQMAGADRLAIASGAAGYDLMVAAGQCVATVVQEYYPGHAVLVLCGPGNNGGDGFIAAMFLENAGFNVRVMALASGWRLRGDSRRAYKSWGGRALDFSARPDMPQKTVVVDAVFGTGLARPLDAPVTEVFSAVRTSGWPVVAVDIPSGINGNSGAADPATLAAAHTVTFFRKKLGHVLMPGLGLCGQVSVHDIGIDACVLSGTGFVAIENAPQLWADKLPGPDKRGHKYDRGHVVMLGGGAMTGAARMASEAAMRAGAGLCTIVCPQQAADIYRRAAPHVMVETCDGYGAFGAHLGDARRNVVIAGPGAGQDDGDGLRAAVLDILRTGRPAVLDADALTCFAGAPAQLFGALHPAVVLTPHEGEFARLFGAGQDVKTDRVMTAARQAGAVVLLKGPDTVIAAPQDDRPVVNVHATPWLATAGSGDVLAGIIAGLMAQGMTAFDAACAAAWIHGEAGIRKGPGLVAPDIVENIPGVISEFRASKTSG